MKLQAAVALALLAAPAEARKPAPRAEEVRTSGTVYKTEVYARSGLLVVVDKDGRTEDYGMRRTTKIFRDGKEATFDAALIGDLVLRASYDPKTKVLSVLELKPAGTAAAGPVKGEVALTDAIKGTLSVRLGKGAVREFAVVETTKILQLSEGQPAKEVAFETAAVGDAVEVRSADGKTADEIRLRPGAR